MKTLVVIISLGIVLISHTLCVQPKNNKVEKSELQNDFTTEVFLTSDDSIIQKLYKKAIDLPLPMSDTSTWRHKQRFTLKKNEEIALLKNGFKVREEYDEFEIFITGKFDFLDNFKYLFTHIESKANGEFYAGYMLILDINFKVLDQILLCSDGIEAPDGCKFEIFPNKTIKTKEYHILESKKIPPNPYTLESFGYKCYCKVIDKQYVISNGKGEETIDEPRFEYYIWNGRDFKLFENK